MTSASQEDRTLKFPFSTSTSLDLQLVLPSRFSSHPIEFTEDPPHPSSLSNIQAKEPFNAEPDPALLVQHNITPENLVYCRNHGPICQIDEAEYKLRIGDQTEFTVESLKTAFPHAVVVAGMQVSMCTSKCSRILTSSR